MERGSYDQIIELEGVQGTFVELRGLKFVTSSVNNAFGNN